MPKYQRFRYEPNLVFEQGSYQVHKGPDRYLLVKAGHEVGFKFDKGTDVNFKKWIKDWEKNARAQLVALTRRMSMLHKEYIEVKETLER